MNMSKRPRFSWTGGGPGGDVKEVPYKFHNQIPVTGRLEIYNKITDTGLKVENKGRVWKGIYRTNRRGHGC